MRYRQLSAGIKAALMEQALAGPPATTLAGTAANTSHVHDFGTPAPPVDPVREANLVLPRKQARREILEQWTAQRDTCLKACIEDVLDVELTDLEAQLEGHELLESLHPDHDDGRRYWTLDLQPLLVVSPPEVVEVAGELRGAWAIQLLRNLPDEVLATLPPGVRPWTGPFEPSAAGVSLSEQG